MNWDVVVVDVSEHPIESPKKTEAVLFRQKEKTYAQKPSCNRKKSKIIKSAVNECW